jgi:hypothetical protein
MENIPLLSAGELLAVMRKETRRILQESQGNRPVAVKKGLELMRDKDIISDRDVEPLGQIVDHVFAAAQGQIDVMQAYIQVKQIHHDMVLKGATPSAVGIANVAVNAFLVPTPDQPTGPVYKPNTGAQIGSVIGACAFFFLGAAGGPFLGTAIGSAIGGAIGDIITNGVSLGQTKQRYWYFTD